MLEAFEVAAHVLGAPGAVARDVGDGVPVLVVRIHEDQRVVRGAPAECAGARVEHTVHAFAVERLAVFRVPPLLLVVGVVADEEVPPHRLVFGRERMKRGDVVIVRQGVAARRVRATTAERARIAARLEQQDRNPASASRAATVPPPAPEPTTMNSAS